MFIFQNERISKIILLLNIFSVLQKTKFQEFLKDIDNMNISTVMIYDFFYHLLQSFIQVTF